MRILRWALPLLLATACQKETVVLKESEFEREWRAPTVSESISLGVAISGTGIRCGDMEVRTAAQTAGRFLLRCDGSLVYRITGAGSSAIGPWATVAAAIEGDLAQVVPRSARVIPSGSSSAPVASAPVEGPEPTLSRKEADQVLAALINLNGLLCAEVVSVTPLRARDRYEVECIEFRGGRHRATYVVDASRGVAEKL